MSKPIYNAINNRIQKNISSFHTPGHKGQCANDDYRYFFQNTEKFDLTELPDTDNLLDPQGVILKSEKKATRLFGAKRTLYSSFGCTLCIQTMLHLASKHSNKKKIIATRNIHRSAINAMALLGITPVWAYKKNENSHKECSQSDLSYMESIIKANPDANAVYITSPNYYGVMEDIGRLSELCHRYGLPLLVDNAHGSHLYFVNEEFRTALCKADMVASSLHKTLPVLTGGAILNINNARFTKEATEARALFAGTSPSYPILTSIDLCIDYLSKNKKAVAKVISKVQDIKAIAKDSGYDILNSSLYDPMRISVSTKRSALNGFELAEKMRSAKIEPEFADFYNVVLIPSPASMGLDFVRLEKFFLQNNAENNKGSFDTPPFNAENFPIIQDMSLREALFSEFECVDIKEAVGKTSFESICNYPPGIPILLPGERITKELAEFCTMQGIKEVRVVI